VGGERAERFRPRWRAHARDRKEAEGPGGFRQALIDRFGRACAIQGPTHPAMLDAAHLYRYADRPEHDLDGGLLLRRDLHALFDRDLLLIDPDNDWRVYLAPVLAGYPEVWAINGRQLAVEPSVRPNEIYLRGHAGLCRASWADQGQDVPNGALPNGPLSPYLTQLVAQ
jgi:hypothetical protein